MNRWRATCRLIHAAAWGVNVSIDKTVFAVDSDDQLTLAELSRCCSASAETLLILVNQGVLSPCGRSQREWRFSHADLKRALQALHLQRDLGINPAGAALAIDLLDEMQQLRQRVRLLEALMFRHEL